MAITYTLTATNFYSKSTGNLDVLATWGTNTDGTGTAPTSFTAAAQIFNVRNNATPTIGSAWTVSGSGSKVIVGDGTNPCNFTIPSTAAVTAPGDISAAATVTNKNTANPTYGTLAATSTVDYNGTGAQTIAAVTYGNLTISGTRASTPAITLASGTVTVAGTFSVTESGAVTYTTTGNTVDFSSSSSQTIPAINYLNITNTGNGARTLSSSGTIGIAGTLTTGSGTYTVTSSTVNFSNANGGTIPALAVASGSNYNNLSVSGGGTTPYVLGANMTVGGDYTQTAGQLDVAETAVTRTLNISGNFILSGGGFVLINGSSVTGATANVTGSASVSGTGGIFLENTSSSSGVALFAVAGNFTATSTSTSIVDFGTGTNTGNEFRVGGNFSKSGTGTFYTTATTAANGFVFNGTAQTFSYAGTNSDYIQYVINSGSVLTLSTGLTFGTATSAPPSKITVNGTLDASTYQIGTGATGSSVIVNGTLKTANTNGFSGSSSTTVNSTNAPTITLGSASTVEYNSASAQSVTARSDYANLTISGGGAKTLAGASTASGVLTLTSGIVSTTATNTLTLSSTATTAISGGSTTAFVNGPLNWTLPANVSSSASVYAFPVGAGSIYLPLSLTALTTGATGPVLQVQSAASNAGGTPDGTTVGSLSTTEYWTSKAISGIFSGASLSLTRQTAVSPYTLIAKSTALAGTYSSIGGTAGSNSITNSSSTGAIASGSSLFYVFGLNSGASNPPALTAASGATVDAPFNVTFADDPTYRAAITGITVNGTALTAGYSVPAGQITFTPAASSPANLLQTPGSKSIVIIATGYYNATVTQVIGAGAANKIAVTTQPAAPATNGAVLATQPVVAIQDQYGNATTSTATVVASVGAGAWTIGGTTSRAAVAGTTTYTDLTATSNAAVPGATIVFSSAGLNSATSTAFNILAPTPTITASPASLTGFVATTGAPTAAQQFTASGTALTANITVTAPAGYELSTDNATFTPTLTLTSSGGSVASTPIYVRLMSGAVGGYSGNVTLASTGATTQNVAVSGRIPASGNYTVGPTGADFTSLSAAATAITGGGVSGPVVVQLLNTYVSTSELYPITFGVIAGSSATNTVTVLPSAGATGLLITGASTTATLDLNGATNVIFDGRAGGAGTTKQLTIDNTAATGVAIRFINDAVANTIKYCGITGVETSASSGVVVFSTTTGTTGNDNNTLDNCDIHDGTSTPSNCVYSSGTVTTIALGNSGNTVSNCNLYNFYNSTSGSSGGAGISLATGTTDWTISGNSFYQTATRTTFTNGATVNGLFILNASGNNFAVTGNYIGGSAPSCGGNPWTINATATVVIRLVQMTVGATTASSLQGNTIQNIAVTTASTSTSQSILSLTTGSFNVGTVTGNTIGSQSATGSISFTQTTSATGLICTAILAGTGTPGDLNISNNTIGGITVANSSTGTISLRGIGIQGAPTSCAISGNTIGSTITPNSFTNSTNLSTLGIFASTTTTSPVTTISNNTVANLNGSGAGSSTVVIGILAAGSTGGAFATTGNTVRNLTTNSTSTSSTTSISIVGIQHTAATTAGQSVSRNTVYGLSNTATSASVYVAGIFYVGPSSGANTIERNLVHSLTAASSGSPVVNGIYAYSSGSATYKNNMVRLGIDATGASIPSGTITFNGILSDTANTQTNAYYFNSVYIGGTGVTTGSAATNAFRRIANETSDLRDNILVNNRSNATGTGKHYLINVAATTTLTSNYNLFYQTGTGAVFGVINTADSATFAAWKTNSSQDANSLFNNPNFISPTGSSATVDLHVQTPTFVESAGVNITSVTDDFDGQTRSALTPTDIGADAGNFLSTNATLSNLALSAGAISPTFDPNTLGYTLSVPNSTTSTTVTPTVTDATSTVKVNGTTVTSGSASGAIALAVGTNTITVAVTAQDGTTTKTYTVTVTRAKADQTITFNALPAKTYGDAPFNLAATASSGLAVTYASSNTSVATVSGSTITIVGAGTSSITASQAGDSNYNAAPNVSQTLTVNKAAQTITFSLSSPVAKSTGSVTLTGTASSGQPVTYASSDPTIASVSGSTLTLLKAGTVTITASQAGNGNYNAASPVPQTLIITGYTAGNDLVTRQPNSRSIKIPVTALLGNDGQVNSDGSLSGTPSITGVTSGTGNGVTLAGAFVFYTPTDASASAPLTFTYTSTDGTSTDTGTVTVTTVAATPFTLDMIRFVAGPTYDGTNTSMTIEFAGVPGQNYHLQYATTMAGPWMTLGDFSTGSTGTFNASFSVPGNQTGGLFFRATR